MRITKKQLRRIIKEALPATSSRKVNDQGLLKTWKSMYRMTGYGGRKIISRDRAWLEFVLKGEEPETKQDDFREVTKLDDNDPEIQRALDKNMMQKNITFAKARDNVDQYDVYSVYATTAG